MHCPYCQLPLAADAPECPACRLSYPRATTLLGVRPRFHPLVADTTYRLRPSEINQLGKRIRAAKLERVPYVLVVGDDDVKAGTVGVNPRGGEVQRDTPFETFVDRLRAEGRLSTTSL